MASMDFLRAVLRGDKKLIKLNVVKFILGLEKYSELTLANLSRLPEPRSPISSNTFLTTT